MAVESPRLTVAIKFEGSTLQSAEKIQGVVNFLRQLQDERNERPVVVLCSMGKTTDNLLVAAEKAFRRYPRIEEWELTRELHLRTLEELGLNRAVIEWPLKKIESVLEDISLKEVLTVLDIYNLVSLGGSMCARIFEAYLNRIGFKAHRYEASDFGFLKHGSRKESDLEDVYHAIARKLHEDWSSDVPALPIVTGFPKKPWRAQAMATFQKMLSLRDSEVWGDVDGDLKLLPEGGPEATTRVYLVPRSDNAALQLIIPSRVGNNRVEAPHQGPNVTWLRRVGTHPLSKLGFGLMLFSVPLGFALLSSRSRTLEMPDTKNLRSKIFKWVFVEKVYSVFGMVFVGTVNVAIHRMKGGQATDEENMGDT